jgi:Protein of unknown function (DUF4240)
MNHQIFWKIIDFSLKKSKNGNSRQEQILIEELSSYSVDEIIDFEIIFRELIIEADDYKVMAAQKIIEGGVSDDSYLYFRCWLIAQGEKIFNETIKNPEYLANCIDNNIFSTSFEELMYVATTAFRLKTGKLEDEEDESFPRSIAQGRGYIYDLGAPDTKGIRYEVEKLPILYPKLCAKFDWEKLWL